MSLKDRIIKKLLKFGKKHRILIYPTLALVAIVSAISQMVCWGKGHGKRFVASILIMAMLVTQSLFLSSDAASVGEEPAATPSDAIMEETSFDETEPEGMGDDAPVAVSEIPEEELEYIEGNTIYGDTDPEKPTQITVMYERVDEKGGGFVSGITSTVDVDADGNFVIPIPTDEARIQMFYSEDSTNFEVSACYTDLNCQNEISGTSLTYADSDAEVSSGVVRLYYKIRRLSYDLVIDDEDGSNIATKEIDVSAYTTAGQVTPEFDYTVDAAVDISAYKTGYTYSGVNYSGGFYPAGGNIHFNNVSGNIHFVAKWNPQKVDLTVTGRPSGLDSAIDNSIVVDGSETITIPYTYGTDLTLPSNTMDGNLSSEAYYIANWEINGVSYQSGCSVPADEALDFVTATANVTDATNIKQQYPINAVWAYKDIILTSNNAGLTVGTGAGEGATLTATYGDTFDVALGAKYKLDNMDSTGFSYAISEADNTILNQYGILQSGLSDGTGNQGIRFLCVDGIKEVPTSTLQITVTITDSNNPGFSQVCPITLNILPKEIELDGSTIKTSDGQKTPTKEYDGNTHIDVKSTADLIGIINGDDVSVAFDQSANFDSAVVGTGKDVTLTGVILSGAQKHRYTIPDTVTVSGIGTIEAKALTLVMSLMDGESDTVKFGMATPKYKLDLDAASIANLAPSDKAAYDSYVLADDTTGFVREYIGFTGWSTPRDLYSASKSYTVVPLISSTGKNYTASASGLSMSFTVTRDDGTDAYELIGDKVNLYYKGLVVKPLKDSTEYDQIRRVTDGKDIAEGTPESSVEAMGWENALTIEDMVDGTISFQMRSSTTGAITNIVTLSNLNVDRKGPVIQKMSASPKAQINSFNFGSYYHSQNGIEFITVKLYYTSEDSPCTKLHYYFVDDEGNESGETTVDFMANPAENNYVATVTIGTANRGQLVVYAENLATNVSERSRIRMDMIDQLATTHDYYEWMVENNIENAKIDVTDADGIPATSGTWYNQLNLTVNAKDDESGVHSIVWNITTPNGKLNPSPSEEAWKIGKNITYIFNYSITDSTMPTGEYSIFATLQDNAGNTVETDAVGPFLVDCKKPDLAIDPILNSTIYQSGIDFHFTVTEGDAESGIRKVTLYKMEAGVKTPVKVWTPADDAAKRRLRVDDYRIVNGGTYILEAEDIAGNISKEERTFTKLSTTAPEPPTISVDGTGGNNGWYKGADKPEATVECQTTTSDGVPVTTKYKITTTNSSVQSIIDSGRDTDTFVIDAQGLVTIEAWSVSEAGIPSATTTKEIKVDIEKPTIEIVNVTKDSDGQMALNFRIKDSVSGVNPSKVTINGKNVTVTAEENGYIGKFIVTGTNTYELLAEDMAGNLADAVSYVPLSMTVAPATDITKTTAHVEAEIHVGTFDVNECYIAYRKEGESNYRTALFNKETIGKTITLNCDFRDLAANTVYEYKVYASNEKAESCIEEGRFRTLAERASGVVYGTVTYDPSLVNKDYPVYVSLYDANSIVASKKLSAESETDYSFGNLSDGSYRVVATNGMLIETAAVTLENGGVILPKTYANDGGVNLVLNGFNTKVVIEDNSINLTADDLESLYDNSIYKGILTDADIAALQNGGSMTVTLYANYMDAGDLSSEEARTFANAMEENVVIERYISLRIVKEVWDADGNNINGTPMEIPELYNPITVSFPLGSLSGQKIYVAAAHENNGNYSYYNWTSAPEATISRDYVTIQTRYFSVYALYRVIPSEKTYKVTWKDGDGQVMKTETVKEGTAATPPTKMPTKKATKNYTYRFTGWDTDYSNITKDSVILAKFEAIKIQPDTPTDDPTDKPTDKPGSTEAPPADITIPDTTPNSYTYLGSPESPKTGDGTPIVLLFIMMSVGGAGMFICHKNNKKSKHS